MNKLFSYLENTSVYLSLLILEITFFTFLNFNNTTMSGILPAYENFAAFFQSGFDLATPFPKGTSTFPMWGYGFVLFLTKNKLIIIIIQQIISFFTILFIEKVLKSLQWHNKSITYFRLFIILGFGWHITHTTLWPYSIAANFMVLSLLLLLQFYSNKKLHTLFISALLFGITLNFRSDYFYFMLCFVAIQFIYGLIKKEKKYLYILLWGGIIMLCLTPWNIYTKQQTGHFLATSTNGGHVLFVGLGQLPNNSWKITPVDGDSLMHQTLISEQGPEYNGSLNYAADKILMKEWKSKVYKSPLEFLKKCSYVQILYILEPYTHGQLYGNFTSRKEWDEEKFKLKNDLLSLNVSNILNVFFSSSAIYLWLILLIVLVSIALNLLFWFVLFQNIYKNWKTLIYNDFFIIAICVIGYQITLQTVAYYMTYYNTNIYIFYILLLSLFLGGKTKKSLA